jgi:tetratricopeptide (TPR) repeat protein
MAPRTVALALASLLATSAALANEPAISPEITGMIRESARGWLDRALTCERDGRALEAEGFFHRALDTDPGLLAAHLGFARMLDGRGRRAEAREALARVPRRAFADDDGALAYARALRAVGAVDESLAALRDRRDSAAATQALAESAAQEGRFPEALAAARRLAEMMGDGPEGRPARVLVRALTRLVAEADAVRAPYATTGFRRALMAD